MIDHLQGAEPEKLFLEVAFNRHYIEGDLAKSIVTGSSPNHVVRIQQMLGYAYGKGWKGIVGAWFRGTNRPPGKFKFYPGKMSSGNTDPVQGVDSVFDQDTPHSNVAWIRLECPNGAEIGIPDADTKNNPPTGFAAIVDCQMGDVYDDVGDVVETDVLLTNPADIIAFGCKEIRRYPNSRIDWESVYQLRQICNEEETPDYTTFPKGLGLTGSYYDGSNFNTLKSTRIDPVIDFPSSNGAPALELGLDAFSVRSEGKIKPKYTETYTFYLTHDDGGRLWVNGNLIIDQWGTVGTHSATINLNADQLYDIKLEWNETGGVAFCKLEWQSASQPRQVVPQDRLYPKAVPQKRFINGSAFTQRTNFDAFLREILGSCNGGYQDLDGKLRFFCIDELMPSFDFNESNIVKKTFKHKPRFKQQEWLTLPNRFIANGRDLDSRYIHPFDPPVVYDVPDLQEIAGRIIEETVYVGTTTQWHALKHLQHYARLRTAPYITEFEGMPQTLPVLPGDLVRVTHPKAGWINKPCLTLEATDKSIRPSPDERIFKLLVWE
jgi:PA14 domain.